MIAILTYNAPHRKTQDLIFRLLALGYSELYVIASPWVERKNFQPIFEHRPSKAIPVPLDKFCERLGLKFKLLEVSEFHGLLAEKEFDHILIAGAGILPDTITNDFKVINSHPGYLPNVRGLDALKWAIYKDEQIGVTVHYINDKPDEGLLIERREVPVYKNDTFHSVAYRQYELEIEMLAHSIELIDSGKPSFESLANNNFQANRRMPNEVEPEMMKRFNERKEKM